MGSMVYIRLIGCTFGTLLQLFWMVVILGYRRQRNFERVFFFLCLALFFFYGGCLLPPLPRIFFPHAPRVLDHHYNVYISHPRCICPHLPCLLIIRSGGTSTLLSRKR